MTTQQTKVDWERPIEAWNTITGATKPMQLEGETVSGGYFTEDCPDATESNTWWRKDGTSWCVGSPWRIRNAAQPEAPTPSPELTARMVALEAIVADLAAQLPLNYQRFSDLHDRAAALLKPVDGDRNEAERIAYDMEGALPRDLVEAGIKAGRALAEAGK